MQHIPQFCVSSQLGFRKWAYIDKILSQDLVYMTLCALVKNDGPSIQNTWPCSSRVILNLLSKPPNKFHAEPISKCRMSDNSRAVKETGGLYPFGSL
jgi:hypothetical protein